MFVTSGTKLLLYSGSDISVTFSILDDNGVPYEQVIDLEAKKTKYSPTIPTGSGALVKSSGNEDFIALSITDSEMYTDSPSGGTEYLTGRAFDWGYPGTFLSSCECLTSHRFIFELYYRYA